MFPIMPALLAASDLPPGSILHFDSALLIQMGIQVLNIAVLVFLLSWLLYKPLVKFLDARTERIRNEMEAVRTDRNEALELKERYNTLLAGIETEREEVLHQAYKKAMERSDQMLFDARREAELIFERSLQELDVEKKSQEEELKRQVVEVSVLLASKIIEVNMDRDAHDRLFDEAMAEWRES
ncbi:MAG: F0F1 ATP synthase subunit B [Clostridiales bacterium]|nr:F0F1 ATP synthase subunit B [Clostridiales bacterium]